MKKYILPIIKSVKLDPKQAMLQVCRAGGIYLLAASTAYMWCSTVTRTDSAGPPCLFTPKGGEATAQRMDFHESFCDLSQALPS
ncbi:MAG: hypothetical protein PHQ52_01775 [Candidatus Omnitrophica bacterium]|nr:hypothetical protein [Candidatus Omnitrophota bacterium]